MARSTITQTKPLRWGRFGAQTGTAQLRFSSLRRRSDPDRHRYQHRTRCCRKHRIAGTNGVHRNWQPGQYRLAYSSLKRWAPLCYQAERRETLCDARFHCAHCRGKLWKDSSNRWKSLPQTTRGPESVNTSTLAAIEVVETET